MTRRAWGRSLERSSPPGLADLGDQALAMAVARWDRAALEEMYRRHGGAVVGLARRVLSDAAAAEEVTQEVFLGLWEHPERFDPDRGTLRTFLLAVTHSRSVDLLRSDQARRRREDRDHREGPQRASVRSIDEEVTELLLAEEVRDAISRLPSAEREAIELAYFGCYSYREVAAKLDTPEGTVKSRIRRGLEHLRDDLADLADLEEGPAT